MDSMDEHDLSVHRDEGPCGVCGAPYEAHTKWNGGNVVTVWLATCECAEKATEAMVDRMTSRIKRESESAPEERGGEDHVMPEPVGQTAKSPVPPRSELKLDPLVTFVTRLLEEAEDAEEGHCLEVGGIQDERNLHDAWKRRRDEWADLLSRYQAPHMLPPGLRCKVCFTGNGRMFGNWTDCIHGWMGKLKEVEEVRERLLAKIIAHQPPASLS